MIRSPVFGEFMGTFIMLLLGDGVVAGCILKRTKAEGSDWLTITAGWGLAVFCGIYIANLFGSPDAFLSPAMTIAFAVKGGSFSKVLPYLAAQVAGAFVGAVVVWLFYMPHWKVTEEPATKLGVFCTIPAIRSYGSNLLSETVATFVLVTVVGSIGSRLVAPAGEVAGLNPLLVSCLIWSIGLSLGATTGYALNPARDFGPRLAHALLPIAGKGGSDWAYSWVPVVGPIVGAALAGVVLRSIGA
jgi:glycerol uptake facilitator protein